MQFDFEQFTKRFKRAYPVARYGRRKQNDGNDCDLFSYDEALEVFREYFLAYEYYMGTAHPQLKREKIIDMDDKKFWLDGACNLDAGIRLQNELTFGQPKRL